MEDIFVGLGLEIELKTAEDFLKVKETLTRIGVGSEQKRQLFQSCHILHKRGRYSIMHFKELFVLDGKSKTFTAEDVVRRDFIVKLLEEWGLFTVVDGQERSDVAPTSRIKVLPFREKSEWELVQKYSIGTK